jgi:hypothetical protein
MELVRAHPAHVKAIIEIARNAPSTPEFVDERFGLFTAHLRGGQEAGEFGPFNPEAMAVAIIGAIDAMVVGLVNFPDLDATEFGRELADTFDRATRG